MILTDVAERLVPTGVAARELGVAGATLVRWWQDGKVTPAMITAGGHGRWDMAELRAQLKALRLPEDS